VPNTKATVQPMSQNQASHNTVGVGSGEASNHDGTMRSTSFIDLVISLHVARIINQILLIDGICYYLFVDQCAASRWASFLESQIRISGRRNCDMIETENIEFKWRFFAWKDPCKRDKK
jgi:hypothetical protein